MASTFRNTIEFLNQIGLYDVILPFLLVFTIVFAILEKTKVLGVDLVNGQPFTKKNMNAIVAFVIAFLVIASTQLVAVINKVMADIVLLLLLAVCFLLLVGAFSKDEEFFLDKESGLFKFFLGAMLLGIVLIFLNALGWLQWILNLFTRMDVEWVSTLVLFVLVILFIVGITWGPKKDD